MSNKHTPGPWYTASTGNHQGLVVSEATGANVAVVYDAKDAPIIAAAHELLAALEIMLIDAEATPAMERDPTTVYRMGVARAAIAKARGDS